MRPPQRSNGSNETAPIASTAGRVGSLARGGASREASGSTCWRRLQEWAGEGILEDIHSRLIEELGDLGRLHLKELVMDATFIRAKKGGTKSAKPSAAKA